eukprot:TRINITY_DN19713_c0_g1_i1.p1 TRINITY_DN19713_c0_g1~~TRINITY_DN19713_c0_g1_i1.p1  ORF type:complete len:263 (+),score=59.93 TRINITY_DN19713_c0_g1_i1:69-857(+)
MNASSRAIRRSTEFVRSICAYAGKEGGKPPPEGQPSAPRLQKQLSSAKTLSKALRIIGSNAHSSDAWPASAQAAAWHALARLASSSPQAARRKAALGSDSGNEVSAAAAQLLDLLRPSLDSFRARERSTCLWAWAKLRLSPKRGRSGPEESPPLAAVCEGLLAEFDALSSRDLSTAVYALGTLKYRHDALLTSVAQLDDEKMSKWSCQDVANVVYACGPLSYYHEDLLNAAATHCATNLQKYKEGYKAGYAGLASVQVMLVL